MNRTMITATNTLNQLQKQMDIVSNNMANIDTTGFKRREASFTDLLVQQFQNQTDAASEANRLTPNGIRQGVGAKTGQSKMVGTQGSLKTTGRPLDFAFTKEGQYFRVLEQNETESAIRYTRDGAFYLSPISEDENMLVTAKGNPVLDEENNPIIFSEQVKNFTLSNKGQLTAELNDGETEAYNLGITLVKNPQFLEAKGDNLFAISEGASEEVFMNLIDDLRSQASIQQNTLEQSNVELAKEMTELVNLQRAYQFQSRSISLADQMMGLVNGIR
jgi:flagellar basal-body rod protein FlgG